MVPFIPMRKFPALFLGLCLLANAGVTPTHCAAATFRASPAQEGSDARGAMDGDRFSAAGRAAWRGEAGQTGRCFWEVDFQISREIGAILQVQGDHDFVFTNAPSRYQWLTSDDGESWRPLAETAVDSETRTFRVHRLNRVVRARHLQLRIKAVNGSNPTLREIEVFASPSQKINFPPWVLLVNSTDDPRLPNHGREFLPLVRSCPGWENAPAQQVWVGHLNPEFLAIEPRPVCALFSGSFKDWCEIDRKTWRGAEKILAQGTLPIWASCGGAQGLAILAETGTDKPWDCPHCRDPLNPKIPIYTHIGHTARKLCGDYSGCLFERGPQAIRFVKNDPVFRGLNGEVQVMESHCGQIEWPPHNWELVAVGGAGTQTRIQCIRRKDRPIYAAQFHIEMNGTPETSRQIMSNFLEVAHNWQSRH